ncbi:hypothetical protein DRJ48_00200 [Candidatus Woesearchaeota archaeon]|nr:Lrp/AsnC family transcriptional regulator [Candidatus Woesearchaeota archaeon]RLE43670.1 MAG: hypothetical protein DRJ48_00200 [Candidatus Woesearchaeota archaeon]
MLKPKELEIIAHLRENARKSLTDISKKTGIPISTIYTKLLTMRGDIIRKHTSLLNFKALGYHTIVLVLLSCDTQQLEKFEHALVCNPNINSVLKLNNEYQFLVEGVFRYIADVDAFLENLEKRFRITKRKILYIVHELKRESFLASPKDLHLYH